MGKALGEALKAIASPEIRATLLKEGAEATPLSSAEFASVIANDVPRWKRIAEQQHIVGD